MNLEKMRRYRLRTMPRPDESITVDRVELEEHGRAVNKAFATDKDWPPPHAYEEWRADVRRYCEAKGIRATFFANGVPLGETSLEEQPPTITFTWRER